jgi:hypothetical protein
MALTLEASRPHKTHHPIEIVEDLMIQRDLAYDLSVENECVAEVAGQWSQYRLWYSWQEDIRVLVFSCAYEIRLPEKLRPQIATLLAKANEKMWLGHFDLVHEDGAIMFRYGFLAGDIQLLSLNALEVALEVAISECDRFYPALQGFIWGEKSVDEALAIAMFETAGEA